MNINSNWWFIYIIINTRNYLQISDIIKKWKINNQSGNNKLKYKR